MFQEELLAHFRTQGRAYIHVLTEVFQLQIARFKIKVTAVQRYAIFPLFAYANLGGAFSHFCWKTSLDWADLAEFWIFLLLGPLCNLCDLLV